MAEGKEKTVSWDGMVKKKKKQKEEVTVDHRTA